MTKVSTPITRRSRSWRTLFYSGLVTIIAQNPFPAFVADAGKFSNIVLADPIGTRLWVTLISIWNRGRKTQSPKSYRAHRSNINTNRPSPESQASSMVSATEQWYPHGAGPETGVFVWVPNYSCRVTGVGRRGRKQNLSQTGQRQVTVEVKSRWGSSLDHVRQG